METYTKIRPSKRILSAISVAAVLSLVLYTTGAKTERQGASGKPDTGKPFTFFFLFGLASLLTFAAFSTGNPFILPFAIPIWAFLVSNTIFYAIGFENKNTLSAITAILSAMSFNPFLWGFTVPFWTFFVLYLAIATVGLA